MYPPLTSLFCLSLLALHSFALTIDSSVPAARHISRHHRIARNAQLPATSQDAKKVVKRASSQKQKRCAAKAAGAAALAVPGASANVTVDALPTTSVATTTHTSTSTTHSHTSTTHAAAPTKAASSGSSSGGEFDQSHTYSGGDATYYGIGLGACGWTNSEPDLIVAMAFELFDGFADAAAKNNPNLNPVCGQYIEASLPGLSSVRVKVVDRCGGCMIKTSLDFSEAAFNQLTNNGMAVGRFHELSWHFTD